MKSGFDFFDYFFGILMGLIGIGMIVLFTWLAVRPPPPTTVHFLLGVSEPACCYAEPNGYGTRDLHCAGDTTVKNAVNYIDTGRPCLVERQ